jgi:hypothetical protein
MGRVQHGAGHSSMPVEVVAVQRGRPDVEHVLLAVAPHRDLYVILLHRPLDFAEPVHDGAVDREQQVALLQHDSAGVPGDRAHDAEHLAPRGTVLLDAADPASAGRACARPTRAAAAARPRASAARDASARARPSRHELGRYAAADLPVSRAFSTAKLDHSARIWPFDPVTTPSKSVGGFTSVATSTFESRNCSVRDSGNDTDSTAATAVDSDRGREFAPSRRP